ncbi:DUF2993 domain-containing protein [Streptomyces sp. NPDC057620]|uniref:LmeA family phospholipid-binding protein n=1 Tax=Streptomyces sp. NPDC057620 TaxID=3346185 RepID=UPI00369C8EC7
MSTRLSSAWLRRRRRVAVGLVAMLVVGAGVSEAVVRHALAARVTTALDGRLGSAPEVSFGSRPVLLAALDETLSSMTVSGRTDAAGYTDVPVTARLSDVTVDRARHTTTVSGSHVTADVSTEAMTRRMASGDGKDAAMISGITTNPTAGTLDLAVQGGLATIRVTPTVADGKLELSVTGGEVLGSPAPPALLDRVQTAVDARPTQDGPEPQGGAAALGLRLAEVTVTDDGLRAGLSGGRAELERTGT